MFDSIASGNLFKALEEAQKMSTRERVRSQTLRIIFYKEGGIHELDASKVVSFIEQNGEVEMRRLRDLFDLARRKLVERSEAL